MKIVLILALVACFAGCTSLSKTFVNRAACTADSKRAVVASMYGPIGVASYIDPDDAAVLCAKPAP